MKRIVWLCALMVCAKLRTQSPLIIGHRGAPGYEPENTLRSFAKAIALGVDMIELDVYVARSGELIVLHDETIDRTTNGKGNVKQVSWNKLKQYDAGKGEHIPLLSEVFDLIDQRVVIDIELKDCDAIQPTADLINHYVQEKQWSYDKFIVSSFDHHFICQFHTYCPQVKTGIIFEGSPIGYADIARHAHAQYAILAYEWITKKFIDDAHGSKIHVFAYTVNDKATAKKLKKLNIDGIITDYPDKL